VVTGQKSFNSIDTKSTKTAVIIGSIANILVSIWPGVLYATTFYKKEHADLRSIFWEFQISIWLNALCRLISLAVFAIAMCRIGDCIKSMNSRLASNGSMVCLNWSLVILAASVQVSLMIFYSLGLIYEENDIFQQYTVVMMYVNVACTCGSQVILSFIFSIMSEPIEIYEETSKSGWQSNWEIRRDNLLVFKQECPREITLGNDKDTSTMLNEPLNTGINDKRVLDMESVSSYGSSSSPFAERNLKGARVKNEETRRLMMMFFSFCEPLNGVSH